MSEKNSKTEELTGSMTEAGSSEKSNGGAEYAELYNKFRREREKNKNAKDAGKNHDPHWLDINPDHLEREDLFYFKLWDTGNVVGAEAEAIVNKEYLHALNTSLSKKEKLLKDEARGKGITYDPRKFAEIEKSRRAFLAWFLNQVISKNAKEKL